MLSLENKRLIQLIPGDRSNQLGMYYLDWFPGNGLISELVPKPKV